MDDLSFLTSGPDKDKSPAPAPTGPLAFLDPAPEPGGAAISVPPAPAPAPEEKIDELVLAESEAEAARNDAGALEVELNLLWIRNPSAPDEARARVKYLEDEVETLEGNERRLFISAHRQERSVLVENIQEYEAIERVYIGKREHYFSLKKRVDQLLKIRESDAQAAKKRADAYAKRYS